jgi:peroxiredoxin Q/BCP
MPSIDWQLAAAIATVVSSVTFAASAIAVVIQLRQTARGHFFSVTSHLFEIWQSPEFQHDQLFLMHKLGRPTWEEFCAGGRGEQAERALHRVGGYYDRVGNLVKHHLINKEEILPTIGGYAVAVWYRIQPLVKEFRLRENAVLFQNYESLLPECHECYVPGLEAFSATHDTSAMDEAAGESAFCEIPGRLNDEPLRINGIAKAPENFDSDETRGERIEMAPENRTINDQTWRAPDLSLPDSDGVGRRLSEFTAAGPAVVLYARGAYCPFCLRQLSDYAERYGDFKRAGIEVVALSPESQRKSRRLRTTLKLPFTVLSDAKFEAATSFGLLDQGPSGGPSPATIMLDSQRRVMLSTRNEGTKSLLARDMLDYARTAKPGTSSAMPPLQPQVQQHKPGWLFARGLANFAVGLVSR